MPDDDSDLPLFSGPHVPRVRFENALLRLDFPAAVVDAPEACRAAVATLARLTDARSPGRVDLAQLVRSRQRDWPAAVERAWQHLVGLRLDSAKIPATLDGEPAAAFLLRAGERALAETSLRRHLDHRPRDVGAWELMAAFDPVRGAARCAFHGGPLLAAAAPVLELIEEDEVGPAAAWLLPYAWLNRDIALGELRAALAADGYLDRPQLTIPGDARAFTWHLLDAGGQPFGPAAVGVVEARARLRQISPIAFRRYMARIAGA